MPCLCVAVRDPPSFETGTVTSPGFLGPLDYRPALQSQASYTGGLHLCSEPFTDPAVSPASFVQVLCRNLNWCLVCQLNRQAFQSALPTSTTAPLLCVWLMPSPGAPRFLPAVLTITTTHVREDKGWGPATCSGETGWKVSLAVCVLGKL